MPQLVQNKVLYFKGSPRERAAVDAKMQQVQGEKDRRSERYTLGSVKSQHDIIPEALLVWDMDGTDDLCVHATHGIMSGITRSPQLGNISTHATWQFHGTVQRRKGEEKGWRAASHKSGDVLTKHQAHPAIGQEFCLET